MSLELRNLRTAVSESETPTERFRYFRVAAPYAPVVGGHRRFALQHRLEHRRRNPNTSLRRKAYPTFKRSFCSLAPGTRQKDQRWRVTDQREQHRPTTRRP